MMIIEASAFDVPASTTKETKTITAASVSASETRRGREKRSGSPVDRERPRSFVVESMIIDRVSVVTSSPSRRLLPPVRGGRLRKA